MEQESVSVANDGGGAAGGPSVPLGDRESSFVDQQFLTKNMQFEGKTVSFCMQAFDGPCPLLAMANVLLLRSRLRIRPGADRLTTSHILQLVGDTLTSQVGQAQNEDLESCLDELRKLQFGLQVNCGFAGCTSFEQSAGFRVFELLGIKVVHGWLPEDPETISVLEKLTYNDVAEMIAMADDIETRNNEMHDNNVTSEQIDLLHNAAIAKRFLESSPSQLTFEGLVKIHAVLKEGELAVMFRNNHFSTVITHGGALYALVTDIGFQHNDDVVWETLNSLHGDTHMVNSAFRETVLHSAMSHHALGGFAQPDLSVGDDDAAVARRFQAESDAAFARSLQLELDAQQTGGDKPVGKLKVIGVEEKSGREILEDEVGHRFVRREDPRKKAAKKKSPETSDDEGEEGKSKCVIS